MNTNPLWVALTESPAHGVFTAEVMFGAILGVIFIGVYARREWWTNHAGRLTMGNMVGLTLLSAGAFMFRLGWQAEALTVLVPTCAIVLFIQAWWLRQLLAAQRMTAQECVKNIAEAAEALAQRLADEGFAEDAETTFRHARALAAISDEKTS